MGRLDIGSTAASDMTNRVSDVTVDTKAIDGAGEQDETEWTNHNWSKYWGYFNAVGDLKSAIIMKAIWDVGKGYTADDATTVILDRINGWGKDTFHDIIFNMEIIKRINGDSFAEIIRNDKGTLINLKPLDPSSIKIIVNRQGIIKRYEQISKVKNTPRRIKPIDMFHLSNNRLADQIHGISDIEAIEKTILAEFENFDDIKRLMHHQAKPMILFKLGTDDDTKIAAFIKKMDKAVDKGENIYVPNDKDAFDFEVITVPIAQAIFEWRNDIRNKFYRSIGLPQVIPGAGGQGTESDSKVIVFAFEQIVHKDQLFLEKQIWNQLARKIKFIHPASLKPELQADEAKDKNQGLAFEPADTTAGVGA